MAAPHDESEFVDTEFRTDRNPPHPAPSRGSPVRPPSREELDSRVQETQQRLEELRRVQGQLEQERANLEEARRRRGEYQTGRMEMVEHLTRGVGLLEEAEFSARQEAEQMARTLQDLREHLMRVQNLNDQAWTQETYAVELTRALTALENARMEWNAARLKWPILDPESQKTGPGQPAPADPSMQALAEMGLGRLCRFGFALTWPIALVVLLAAAALTVALFARQP